VLDTNKRGLGIAIFATAPFFGPALGPISSDFLGLKAGWRWIEAFLAIFCGSILIIIIIVFSFETYAPPRLSFVEEQFSSPKPPERPIDIESTLSDHSSLYIV